MHTPHRWRSERGERKRELVCGEGGRQRVRDGGKKETQLARTSERGGDKEGETGIHIPT